MKFYVGLHQPYDARKFKRSFISINRIRGRKYGFKVDEWIIDSGAFTELSTYGHYRYTVKNYADEIRRWRNWGKLKAAVTQDYMCEKFILDKTGLTIDDHQRLTIERYDKLIAEDTGVYIMPVLQGYAPADYVKHLALYGSRLAQGAYVGVGSICKRNGKPELVLAVLEAIKQIRPDLLLHGFGLKITALAVKAIRRLLYSADSMAWSFSARREGRNANDWREAKAFEKQILGLV